MKKLINILLASALLVGATTSCEDFLQKDPPGDPSQSVFWQRKSDFDSALAGCYSIMYQHDDPYDPGVMSQIIACLDNLTDNSICQYDEGTYGKTKTIALGDLTPQTDGFVTSMYAQCYRGITRIHLLMENLDQYKGTDITAEERNFMIAQCKALRGYFYSWLYQCYREVPLVTSSLSMDNMHQAKADRTGVYTQIMKDFDEAIAELPDKVYSEAQVSGRMTVSAVKVLKARLLLTEAYDESGNATDVAKLKEVVSLLESIGGYSLAPRMRDNFLSSKQLSSPEILFSVRYMRPNLLHKMDVYYGAWATCQVTRDFLNAFEYKDGLKWGESPLTPKVDEKVMLDGNTDAAKAERIKLFKDRDRRLSETVMHSNIGTFPDEGFEDAHPTIGDPQTHFGMNKLVEPTKIPIEYMVISDADIVIIRYAEVLLMIAEAENEASGATAKVYDAVNTVRARSGMIALPAGLSKDQMRERIRNEWRVETAFEGLRYFQLKRWKLMEKLVNGAIDPAIETYKKVFKPAFYFWPLPQGEIDKSNGVLVQDSNYK